MQTLYVNRLSTRANSLYLILTPPPKSKTTVARSCDNEIVISVNGCLSKNESDQLRLDLRQINLEELSSMLKLEVKLAGTFSGFANITNPYDNLGYTGDALVEQLYIDGEEVGNVAFNLDYFAKQERIRLDGNLDYKNQKTLDFQGFYYLFFYWSFLFYMSIDFK